MPLENIWRYDKRISLFLIVLCSCLTSLGHHENVSANKFKVKSSGEEDVEEALDVNLLEDFSPKENGDKF